MKNLKIFGLLIALFIGLTGFAPSNAKVIALVTKASWCPVCQKNGDRMAQEVFSSYMDGKVKVVMNDVSDDNTRKACKKEIEENKLKGVADKCTMTGIITLVNAKSGKVISSISVAKSTDEIKKAIDEAIAKS